MFSLVTQILGNYLGFLMIPCIIIRIIRSCCCLTSKNQQEELLAVVTDSDPCS